MNEDMNEQDEMEGLVPVVTVYARRDPDDGSVVTATEIELWLSVVPVALQAEFLETAAEGLAKHARGLRADGR